MNIDQQKASFEAWYMQHNKLVPTCPAEWVFTTSMDSGEYADKNVQIAYEAWQAALESPEVEALRKDSQRLSAIESDEGADIIRLSSDEWEVSGYVKELYGTGRTLREAIDNAIKEVK